MKSKRLRKHSSRKKRPTRRNKKRGGVTNPFLKPSSYSFANTIDCSKMDVDSIKNIKELHTRYQKCCPKTMLGYKNSSPICKKMNDNFNKLWKIENDSHAAYGYENTPTITP
jgi:hypothetical protein